MIKTEYALSPAERFFEESSCSLQFVSVLESTGEVVHGFEGKGMFISEEVPVRLESLLL